MRILSQFPYDMRMNECKQWSHVHEMNEWMNDNETIVIMIMMIRQIKKLKITGALIKIERERE